MTKILHKILQIIEQFSIQLKTFEMIPGKKKRKKKLKSNESTICTKRKKQRKKKEISSLINFVFLSKQSGFIEENGI